MTSLGSLLEEKDGGSVKTYENNPESFKFSATSGSRTFSESEAFSLLVANDPSLLISLGNIHASASLGLTSGHHQ